MKSLADEIRGTEVNYNVEAFIGLADWACYEAGIGRGLEAAAMVVESSEIGQRISNIEGLVVAARDAHFSIVSENWATIASLVTALNQIIDRSNNGELGTSKVIDMRRIAEKALTEAGVLNHGT